MPESHNITVAVANLDEMRLRVTAEFTIGQWRQILTLTKGVQVYRPLDDLLCAIDRGVRAICERETVNVEVSDGQ